MKNNFVLFLCCLGYSLFGQIPTNGLIGGWPFTGNANDISINANHGTPNGATLTTDRFNQANCAYYFNGTSDYIVMLNAGLTGTVSRSVSFWAQTSNTLIQVSFNYGAPSAGGGIWQVVSNYNCTGYGFDQSTAAAIRGNTVTTDNNWHHIVAVQNSTNGITVGSVEIYVDGVLQPSITCNVSSTAATISTNNSFPITIGRGSSSAVRFFKGKLDDFYFYDRALTPTEILQLYNDAPCAGPPSAPASVMGQNTICNGANYTYSVTPISGATSYSWTLPIGWSGSSNTNTISLNSNGTSGTIGVTASNACGQSAQFIFSITCNSSPTVSITSSENTICIGNLVNLSASGANTYTWVNGSIIAPMISVSPTITTSYTVIGTNSVGCKSSSVKTVTVNNFNVPTILTSGAGTSCVNQAVSLASNGAQTYTWQPGNLNGFLISVTPSITTTYTVWGTDINGCKNFATCTQSVISCDPNGITEQTNGGNNVHVFPNPFSTSFQIKTLLSDKIKIEIYNVAGEIVYETVSENSHIEISLSSIRSGIYFLKITSPSINLVQKLVKY